MVHPVIDMKKFLLATLLAAFPLSAQAEAPAPAPGELPTRAGLLLSQFGSRYHVCRLIPLTEEEGGHFLLAEYLDALTGTEEWHYRVFRRQGDDWLPYSAETSSASRLHHAEVQQDVVLLSDAGGATSGRLVLEEPRDMLFLDYRHAFKPVPAALQGRDSLFFRIRDALLLEVNIEPMTSMKRRQLCRYTVWEGQGEAWRILDEAEEYYPYAPQCAPRTATVDARFGTLTFHDAAGRGVLRPLRLTPLPPNTLPLDDAHRCAAPQGVPPAAGARYFLVTEGLLLEELTREGTEGNAFTRTYTYSLYRTTEQGWQRGVSRSCTCREVWRSPHYVRAEKEALLFLNAQGSPVSSSDAVRLLALPLR